MGRYRLLGNTTPDIAADTVVNWYVENAQRDLATWATNYQDHVNAYISNPDKINMAKKKLALWYSNLLSVRSEISQAINRAKASYLNQKKNLIQRPSMR